MNEKAFNIGLAVLVSAVIAFLVVSGSIDKSSVVGMFGAIGFNVVLLLTTGFGLQYFQLGTGRDLQKEIYDENNTAAAIYQAGIWVALGLVIAKGM